MSAFVEVEVFIVLTEPPEKQTINPDHVLTVKTGDSSRREGTPDCCVVTLINGTVLKVKGTEHDVRNRLGK